MTEEIKEIFYKLRSDDYYEKHYQQSVYYEKDLNKLENYITNLQKENEDLKKEIEHYKIMFSNYFYEELYPGENEEDDIYKQRNEKAVEYIKSHNPSDIGICGNNKKYYYTLNEDSVDNLLNILEGGDE